jgi:glycosyltransferase involved in cell wall biosynthesis
LGGPGVIVNHASGFKIKPGNIDQIVFDIADTLAALTDPELHNKISDAAVQRAREYDWHNQIARIEEIYQVYLQSTNEERSCVLQS